jgi:hypothetical protein
LPPKHALRLPASMPFFKPHPCCLTYFLATAQESKQRKPLTTKVFNRTKRLILRSFRMCPFKLHSNDFLVICPKKTPFYAETLKAEKAAAVPPKHELSSLGLKMGKNNCFAFAW